VTRWPAWLHDALRLGPHEVERVRPGLPDADLDRLRGASEVDPDAVDLLVRRLAAGPDHRPPTRVRPAWIALPVAFAAAAALVTVLRGDRPSVPLDVEVSLARAGALRLGPSIVVDGLGDVVVERSGPDGTVVAVTRGSVRFDVDPDGPERNLAVRAGDTWVRVKGTEFVVHALYDSVQVDVLSGLVSVERGGAVELIHPGERYARQGSGAVAAFAPAAASVGPSVAASLSPTISSPPPSGPLRSRASQGPAPSPLAEPSGLESAAPSAPTSVDRSEAAVDYAAVLDRLEAEGPPQEIVVLVDRFLARHPSSALVPELSAVRLEATADLEPARSVVAAVDAWLDRYQDHPRRVAMLSLRATLARDRLRDCALALPTYRTLAVEAPADIAAEAEAWRGLCAIQVGRRDEARTALDRARTLGVAGPLRGDVLEALSALGPERSPVDGAPSSGP
jgi:hypothetical protein